MLIVLSPAKTLDFESPIVDLEPTRPEFAADSRRLIARLREHSAADLASLMTLSPALAELNVARYAAFRATPRPGQSRPAVLAFDGDVYDGLAARRLDLDGLAFAQQHVRILSGLYGVLRPLDAMQPHRLEMGTRLSTERGANLYGFWGDKPARALKRAMRETGSRVLINLASDEYSRVIDRDVLGAKIIAPVFIVILIGWLMAGSSREDRPHLADVNKLNMDLFCPALIFMALSAKDFDVVAAAPLALGSLVVVIGAGLLAWAVARAALVDARTFVPSMMFNNCGNMGLPLAYLTFGEQGLAMMVVLFVTSNFLMFTFGMRFVRGDMNWTEAILNPMVLATIAGTICGVLKVTFPA
jgi:cytoplasmic iron level regulating protein YaaA (DUF328/UPF0246 family)